MTSDKAIEILGYLGVEGNNPDEFDACNMGILAIQALSEIRDEIVARKDHHEWGWAYDDALEIIDKYKESVSKV